MTETEKVIVGPTTGHDVGCSCNMYGCRDTNTISIRISTLLIRLCVEHARQVMVGIKATLRKPNA